MGLDMYLERMPRYGNTTPHEIREQLHAELAPCDEQAFFDAYVREHKKKFNENFNI